jgi:hypothetical protein
VSIAAQEESKTVIDAEDDVIDYLTQETSDEYPDIDILELAYVREGINVTVSLKVKGDIRNLGNLDDPTGFGDIVTYGISLITSENNMYAIVYVNETCILETIEKVENITDFSVVGDTLTINFNLNSSDETYTSISAESGFLKFALLEEDIEWYIDIAADEPVYILSINIPDIGEVGKPINFSALADLGEPPYSYHWNFGDGDTSDKQRPTHIFDKAGTYNVTLTVTDNSDETAIEYAEIEIVSGDDNGTPGFELIIAIAAIGFILLWKRKIIS